MASIRAAAAAFSLIYLLAGCGGPSTDPEQDGGPEARDAQPDTGPAVVPCATNDECDDGVFCNGGELCEPGHPSADARGCRAGPARCMEGQTCDEAMRGCLSDCGAEPDADDDGYRAANCGGEDCDDASDQVNPSKDEICDADGRDEDCDPDTLAGPTETDVDGDGYVWTGCCNFQRTGALLCGLDCDDDEPTARPGYPESCDDVDNDCDDGVDEGVRSTFYRDVDGDLYGDAADSTEACAQPEGYVGNAEDCDDGVDTVHPTAPETCNEDDDDCDDAVDEEVTPAPATEEHCGGCGLACPAGYTCTGTMCEDRPVQLAAGLASMCALTEAGDVYCWGGNSQGEVGIGSTSLVIDRPMRVALPLPARDVAIRAVVAFPYVVQACAVLMDGSVHCWGTGIGNTPGSPPFSDAPEPIVDLSSQFLARVTSGNVYAVDPYSESPWSWNSTTLGSAAAVTGHCARQSDGSMRCRDRDGSEASFPEAAGGTVQSAGSWPSVCATGEDNRLRCWGENAGNQIGPYPSQIAAPRLVVGLPNLDIVDVAVSSHFLPSPDPAVPPRQYGHTCAAVVDGRTYCWGQNRRGQLGTGSSSDEPTTSPVLVSTTERFVQVAAGFDHTCAISEDGEVWCWGANDGRLGTADETDAHVPTRLFGFPVVVTPTASP